MRAGRLQARITIQEQATTQDAYGENTGTWSDVVDLYAWIAPVSGQEGVREDQTSNQITHRITIRWRSGITPRNRVTYNSRIFNIHSVRTIDEQAREMILDCVEMVGQTA